MPNFNAQNPLVSNTFLYSYGGTPSSPTVSAFGVLGVNCSNSLATVLSGNGNTSNFTASATLNVYLGQTISSGITGLTAIVPPKLTFIGISTNQSTEGYISTSSLNPALSTAVFTIDFDALAFHETTFALSGNRVTIVDNG